MDNNVTISGTNASLKVSIQTTRKWKSNAQPGMTYNVSLHSIDLQHFRNYLVNGTWYTSPDNARNICNATGLSFNKHECAGNSASNSAASLTPAQSKSNDNSNSWNTDDDY